MEDIILLLLRDPTAVVELTALAAVVIYILNSVILSVRAGGSAGKPKISGRFTVGESLHIPTPGSIAERVGSVVAVGQLISLPKRSLRFKSWAFIRMGR